MQSVAPVPDSKPSSQAVHHDESGAPSSGLYVLAGQSPQVSGPETNFPAAHGEQEVDLAAEMEPAGQVSHSSLACLAANVPAAQSVHVFGPVWAVPGGHGVHSCEPAGDT